MTVPQTHNSADSDPSALDLAQGATGAALNAQASAASVSAAHLGIARVTPSQGSAAQKPAPEIGTLSALGFEYAFELDEEGHILDANAGARSAFGGTLPVWGTDYIWSSLWWAANDVAAARLRAAIARASTSAPVSYYDEFAEASLPALVLEMVVSRVASPDGAPANLVLEVRDVAKGRAVEQQENETLTAIGRVAAKIAHEINNPLGGIQLAFMLIKDAVPADHPHFRYVGAIEREIASIASVTRRLYETYQLDPEVRPDTSLSSVIASAISFMGQVNGEGGVRIELDMSGAPSVVRVSGAVLRQILYELLQNAMDAAPDGTTVRISARVLNDQLELTVADAGPGVPLELRERIFEPFFSTKGRRHGASGLGLGLSLVRRAISAAHGQIKVETSAAGGAAFIATLPLRVES
ncbi:MAG TPA: ATP-binding protein [Gemmatimonadaceae bacterium]|nr:ATP-binding protein [Gemmatimonadaceae bacterium]